MQIDVQFHRNVTDDLRRWATGGDGADDVREGLVQVFVDELVRVLTETAGEPPGAVRVNTSEPRVYSWTYTGEVTLTYEVRTPVRRLFRFGPVRIIVREIRLRSPR